MKRVKSTCVLWSKPTQWVALPSMACINKNPHITTSTRGDPVMSRRLRAGFLNAPSEAKPSEESEYSWPTGLNKNRVGQIPLAENLNMYYRP